MVPRQTPVQFPDESITWSIFPPQPASHRIDGRSEANSSASYLDLDAAHRFPDLCHEPPPRPPHDGAAPSPWRDCNQGLTAKIPPLECVSSIRKATLSATRHSSCGRPHFRGDLPLRGPVMPPGWTAMSRSNVPANARQGGASCLDKTERGLCPAVSAASPTPPAGRRRHRRVPQAGILRVALAGPPLRVSMRFFRSVHTRQA